MTTAPIRPDQVVASKAAAMPDAVLEVFNELIAENWDGYSAVVKQAEAVDRIVAKLLPTMPDVNDRIWGGWLNVEPHYRLAGWIVEYDKPAYNETYPATFTFRAKRPR